MKTKIQWPLHNYGGGKIFEWCPLCDKEVQLKAEFHAQICPACKRPVLPCQMCDQETMDRTGLSCEQCPLKDGHTWK